MNRKICTHPDGCQNKEPRQCLNEGCQLQDGEDQQLSTAELAAKKYLQERYETDYIPDHWVRTVAEYSAENGSLLKEAIDLLDRSLIYMAPETSEEGELIEYDISEFINKLTGKEGGNT